MDGHHKPRRLQPSKRSLQSRISRILLKRVDVAFFADNADPAEKARFLRHPWARFTAGRQNGEDGEEFLADAKRSVQFVRRRFWAARPSSAPKHGAAISTAGCISSPGACPALKPARERLKLYYVRGPQALSTQGVGGSTFWYGELGGANMVVESRAARWKGLGFDEGHRPLEPGRDPGRAAISAGPRAQRRPLGWRRRRQERRGSTLRPRASSIGTAALKACSLWSS